jgi:hypothetical protein
MTYYIDSYYLNSDYLKKKLKDWKESENPLFVYLDGEKRYSQQGKIIQKKKVLLKNVVITDMTDKWALYKKLSKYMPKSLTNKNNVVFKKGSKYIIRPVEGWAGKDLSVVKTKKQLDNHLNKIKNKYRKEIVISEYIPDLLLYKGKIFHLRVYFIVAIINGEYKTYKVNYILTATAKKEFSEEKERNKNVYDSHLTNTGKDIIFPDDFNLEEKNIKKIQEQIDTILKEVSNKFVVKCYPESKNCFEILGVDFMIDKKFKVKMLEINSKVSFYTYSKKTKNKLSKIIFDDIFTQFISPIFYNKYEKPINWTSYKH